MPTARYRSPLPVPPAAAFAWHARPGAFERLTPPWSSTELDRLDGIRDGDRARFRLDVGPVRLKWVAEHTGYAEGEAFEDVMRKGPFRRWHHVHRMYPADAGAEGAVLDDEIAYRLPFGPLGRLGEGRVRAELDRTFAYRHRTTAADLADHARYSAPPLRIALTGASGVIGTALTHYLTTGGHTVLRLVRRAPQGPEEVGWDPRAGEVEAAKLEGLDAVVHLAGEGVFAPRWTDEKKARILRSREQGTGLLATTLARLARPPRAFVSASAIGYYGDRGAEPLTEASAPSDRGFLPLVVRMWEAATAPAADAGIRTVQMRTGVVLTPRGGALRLALPAFRLALGGTVGGGDDWLSWVGLDDVLGAYLHALATDTVVGPVNLTAPAPVTQAAFSATLARVLHRPAVLPVPGPLLEALTGEVGRETVLASARVLPERLGETGYRFRHGDLETALRHALGRPRPRAPFPAV